MFTIFIGTVILVAYKYPFDNTLYTASCLIKSSMCEDLRSGSGWSRFDKCTGYVSGYYYGCVNWGAIISGFLFWVDSWCCSSIIGVSGVIEVQLFFLCFYFLGRLFCGWLYQMLLNGFYLFISILLNDGCRGSVSRYVVPMFFITCLTTLIVVVLF